MTRDSPLASAVREAGSLLDVHFASPLDRIRVRPRDPTFIGAVARGALRRGPGSLEAGGRLMIRAQDGRELSAPACYSDVSAQ